MLHADVKAEPARIPYYVHIDPRKPGYFMLSWIVAQSSSPLKSLYIAVTSEVCIECVFCLDQFHVVLNTIIFIFIRVMAWGRVGL